MPSAAFAVPECKSCSGNCDSCAMKLAGLAPNFYYRYPMGVLAQLAVHTKGIVCPLLDPYRDSSGNINSACYDSEKNWKDGGPACSRAGWTAKSVRGMEKSEQSSECVLKTLGPLPISLVDEVK
jgi:hypothetical protein